MELGCEKVPARRPPLTGKETLFRTFPHALPKHAGGITILVDLSLKSVKMVIPTRSLFWRIWAMKTVKW